MPDAASSAASGESLPRWRLDSIYTGFDSAEYSAAKSELASLAVEFLAHIDAAPAPERESAPGASGAARDSGAFAAWLKKTIALQNRSDALSETLSSYCYAVYSTDTTAKRAMNELNAIEELCVPFSAARARYLNALFAHEGAVRSLIESDPEIGRYRFVLEDDLFWQTRQMTPPEESLAADLARAGSSAWGRLQEQMTSTADCLWDEASGARKTLVELRSLAYDPDRATREKAFKKELEICRGIGIPVAAALNGIKGWTVSLNERRGWAGDPLAAALEKSTKQGLLTRKALDALIGAMEESLPAWRRYLKAKARLLGLESCAFFDLFAPVGATGRKRPFAEARDTVTANFARFSPEMGEFARKAFSLGWIDAEPRGGKVGGAYFTNMPLAKEGRVLCNYDSSFSSILTVAHELGHAYHADVLKDEPALLQAVPMTLAETASIFAETVVFEDEVSRASGAEKLGLLELHLQDGCQILVDILSRFYFERSVFAARKKGELTVDDFCALMADAQQKTYGDGLDPERLHPYMWLVKTHYYSDGLAFYNFPYAFGQLFALALYGRYRAEGASFAEAYRQILGDTGSMDAVTVTARAGFDIETPDFWRSGIKIFIEQIDEFERLVGAGDSRGRPVTRQERD